MQLPIRQAVWLLTALLVWASPARAQTALPAPTTRTLGLAPDHSLTTAEYVKLGVPSPAQPWSEAELRHAVVVLDALADKDPLLLPRLESAGSQPVFARLVAPVPLPKDVTNLEQFRFHIAELSVFAPPAGVITQLYAKQVARNLCFDAELVEATRAALEVNTRLLQTLNRARATLEDKPAPVWLRRQDIQVVWGAELTIRGALFIFSARRAFRPEWREKLGKLLEKWLPSLMAQMPEPTHDVVLKHLHGLMMEDPKGYPDWQPIQQLMTFAGHGPPAFPPQKRGRKARHKPT